MKEDMDRGEQTLESLFSIDKQLTSGQFKQVLLHEKGTGLEFEDITYTVVKKQKREEGWVTRQVDLLQHITGYAPRGHITAVMGPSGAGKSTFLDALAGRIASGSLQGFVTLEGRRVSPSLIKRVSAYVMQDDQLFPMLTVWETLRFAADMRLPESMSKQAKDERVEKLIMQLGLSNARNTYIGDEAHRGVSGGERRRVSIGVDIVHGPNLLFLDEPTSGLDSTSAYGVIEKIHEIAKAGSNVVLTIHQPSYRILTLLNHLIILARGKLMYQGSPHGINGHISGLGRQVPKGENPIEFLLDIIQEFDQSTTGVDPLVEYYLTGIRPDVLNHGLTPKIHLASAGMTPLRGSWKPIKSPFQLNSSICGTPMHDLEAPEMPMTPSQQFYVEDEDDFDHSLVKQSFTSTVAASPWIGVGTAASFYKGMIESAFTPRHNGVPTPMRSGIHSQSAALAPMWPHIDTSGFIQTPQAAPRYTAAAAIANRSLSEIVPATPTPGRAEIPRLYREEDFDTDTTKSGNMEIPGLKFENGWFREVLILMARNFRIIRRTPELFLSRQIVLTVMGLMMATMFMNPGDSLAGVTKLMSFFIFTVCLFFFSSNDAVPTFIMERFIFIRETSHNAYRCSSYVIAGIITYLPFLAFQALSYTLITWWALDLKGYAGGFWYFWLILYASLVATNSLVVFVSALVPNFILGYSAVIAFTAIFFLTCGYFVNRNDIPDMWIWLHYISIIKYPYEGMLHNQFEEQACYNTIDFGNGTSSCFLSSDQVLKGLAIDKPATKWDCLLILLAWAVFYRFLFYLVLRFASKNQRK